MGTHRLDSEVTEALRAVTQKGDNINDTMRRMLQLPKIQNKRGRPSRFATSEWGTHTYLEHLTIGQSVTMEWKYENGKEAAGAVNAHALQMAVQRAKKRSGHKLKTAASIHGLIVTRIG